MRVYNHSSTPILLDNGIESELAANSETTIQGLAFIRPPEKSQTIMGQTEWSVTEEASIHVVDDPSFVGSDLPVRLSALGLKPKTETKPTKLPKHAFSSLYARPRVTILGAGIAGLTAAHELIERGFDVHVIEKSHGPGTAAGSGPKADEYLARGLESPDIGGVARTQWCTAPLDLPSNAVGLQSLTAIHGGIDVVELDGALGIDFNKKNAPDMSKLDAWLRLQLDAAALQIVIVVYSKTGIVAAYERLQKLMAELGGSRFRYVDFMPAARVDIDGDEEKLGALIRYHRDSRLVAGEHGYRSIPGGFRHLRDTMRRTPIYDPRERRFTTKSVYENLTPLRFLVVDDPTREAEGRFSREPPSTLGAVVKQYWDLRRELGYRPSDLLRFSLRLLRYMTSSKDRREQYYEQISWYDFLSLRHLDDPKRGRATFAQRFDRVLKHSLPTVVAVSSKVADARTVGNFSTQLVMESLGLNGDREATFRGPSSDVWLQPWREYLEHRGVQFFLGEVTRISKDGVEIETPRGERDPLKLFTGNSEKDHYYVCAMDAVSVARATDDDLGGVAGDIKDFVAPDAHLLARHPASFNKETLANKKQSRFQTFTGLQLYYHHVLSPNTSHTYYADSGWNLSSISQLQQWDRAGSTALHISSTLSIDIGSWRERKGVDNLSSQPLPSQVVEARSPSELAPSEVVEEVMKQLSTGRPGSVPTPAFFHLDDFIQFKNKKPAWNRAPYLVNLVDDWKNRPRGEPLDPLDVDLRPRMPGDTTNGGHLSVHRNGGYIVQELGEVGRTGNSKIVFAGTHMRTFTRLGSMESANESARHAVNAILDNLTPTPTGPANPDAYAQRMTPHGAYCEIWNPEDNELSDLEFLRLIDKHLIKNARVDPQDADDVPPGKRVPLSPPHIFDLLGVDELPDFLDDDSSSERVFGLLHEAFLAIQKLTRTETLSIFSIVDTFKQKLQGVRT